ncbi:MAG TPA: type II toxin-antitoxin system ParD family antitoxin [Longimicrobium sp.]|jgi:antitoxin ParD1/3/4|uniref:type II toxin-antitoxin system ParD family antitoxin n=1 Tax=Longimicrobium sp. TaxID=2029185 RepID=UPI002ED9F507
MNVSLTPELERMVEEKVRSGQYRTASEVVREGLRLLAQRDEEYQVKLAALRAEIQKGVDSLDRGEGMEGDEAFAWIRARLREGASPEPI